jgi:hypothetical protein
VCLISPRQCFITAKHTKAGANGPVSLIRSYAAPVHDFEVPVGHKWTINETASATAASSMFFQPLTIEKGGSSFVFEDAGSSRVNNPTALAYEELTKHPLFENRKIGCIVSLGTGKHSSCSVVSNDSEESLQQLLSDLSQRAADTEAVHQTLVRKLVL